ncbi:hypothetical protein FRC11_013821 [Ceratobasidium sp. 423]|nr:hypothetical protein FRC11_013821 [Ceratobasidium sp. 423]
MSATSVASVNLTNILRRPNWRVGGLIIQEISGLVNMPGLKDAVSFAKEGTKALEPNMFQAPKLNDIQARKQMDSVKGLINCVDVALATRPSPDREELGEVEVFRRAMEVYKAEIQKLLARKYCTKLACQYDIAKSLAQKKKEVSSCITDFCVSGSVRAYQATQMVSEFNQQSQILSDRLEGESRKLIDLGLQVKAQWCFLLMVTIYLYFL